MSLITWHCKTGLTVCNSLMHSFKRCHPLLYIATCVNIDLSNCDVAPHFRYQTAGSRSEYAGICHEYTHLHAFHGYQTPLCKSHILCNHQMVVIGMFLSEDFHLPSHDFRRPKYEENDQSWSNRMVSLETVHTIWATWWFLWNSDEFYHNLQPSFYFFFDCSWILVPGCPIDPQYIYYALIAYHNDRLLYFAIHTPMNYMYLTLIWYYKCLL